MFSIQLRNDIFAITENGLENEYRFTFYNLRRLLMNNKSELNEDEIKVILDLFIYGLENSTLVNESTWKDKAKYFRGNIQFKDADKWRALFVPENMSLPFLIDYMEYLKSEPTRGNFDFSLRNVEYTLHHHVKFHDEVVYKAIIKSVLIDILDGKFR